MLLEWDHAIPSLDGLVAALTRIRVRGRFTVKLSAHGIKIPGMAAAKVNDRWTVKVSLFARQVP